MRHQSRHKFLPFWYEYQKDQKVSFRNSLLIHWKHCVYENSSDANIVWYNYLILQDALAKNPDYNIASHASQALNSVTSLSVLHLHQNQKNSNCIRTWFTSLGCKVSVSLGHAWKTGGQEIKPAALGLQCQHSEGWATQCNFVVYNMKEVSWLTV